MHDLETIRHLNREELNKFREELNKFHGTTQAFIDSTPIYQAVMRGTLPPNGSTPTTAHDAVISSQVARKRERWATPPIFAELAYGRDTIEELNRKIFVAESRKRHAIHRRETFSEFTNVRWYELDRHSDEL